jgi:hypothetical protein
MSRLATLENRYEKLVEANYWHRYSSSDKIERYLKVLREIKTEMVKEQYKIHNSLDKSNYKFSKKL